MDTDVTFAFREAPDEGGYEARAPDHSIFTQADTMEELEANVKEAVACHFAERNPPPTIRLVKVLPNAFRFGSAKGEFTVPDDFNDPDPEIEDLFNNGPLFPE
jgi:predicted RNase H-like HicB family nuclease